MNTKSLVFAFVVSTLAAVGCTNAASSEVSKESAGGVTIEADVPVDRVYNPAGTPGNDGYCIDNPDTSYKIRVEEVIGTDRDCGSDDVACAGAQRDSQKKLDEAKAPLLKQCTDRGGSVTASFSGENISCGIERGYRPGCVLDVVSFASHRRTWSGTCQCPPRPLPAAPPVKGVAD